jgi:hypothetical protein
VDTQSTTFTIYTLAHEYFSASSDYECKTCDISAVELNRKIDDDCLLLVGCVFEGENACRGSHSRQNSQQTMMAGERREMLPNFLRQSLSSEPENSDENHSFLLMLDECRNLTSI